MTKYLVLKKIHDGDGEPLGWRIVDAPIEAATSHAAIRAALKKDDNEASEDGDYVATPLRSWQPITIKRETITTFVVAASTP